MLRYQTIKSKYLTSRVSTILQTALYLTPVLLCSMEVMAAATPQGFDLDRGAKAIAEPIKKMVNDYYPVAIFVAGAIGALLKSQGDLRERMIGFGLGSLAGGLTVIGVKAGLGI